MATIIGDYIGTTFDDFLVRPGRPLNDSLTSEHVTLECDLCGIKLGAPFLTSAMRSVTGRELALAAGKGRIMAVAPRGLSVEDQVGVVSYVKDREVKPGDIETQMKPVRINDDHVLGDALELTRRFGYSNIPVVSYNADFVGMFSYRPAVHDIMPPDRPITEVMQPFKDEGGRVIMDVCNSGMPDPDIKRYLVEKGYRLVPVLDGTGRLSRLVFLQRHEAYKVGAAIDTHEGWDDRARALIEAGADMIFMDTSDADKWHCYEIVRKFKEMFPNGPPFCGGNIVTASAFDSMVNAGADAVKIGMGPGSICSTNVVLGVGAAPFSSLVEVARARDIAAKRGRYVPVIADGGMENTGNMSVALTHADDLMLGRMYGCFDESAGEKIMQDGRIVAVRIYGEASMEAYRTTGNMRRYTTPGDGAAVATFQGVSGTVPYAGKFHPANEAYKKSECEALWHAGCADPQEYRARAIVERLSERAKQIARPHGISVIG